MTNTLSNGRTPEEQLAQLDFRFGKSVGAVKERAKLDRLINGPKKKPKEAKTSERTVRRTRKPNKAARQAVETTKVQEVQKASFDSRLKKALKDTPKPKTMEKKR